MEKRSHSGSRMGRRLLSVLLALVFLVGALPVGVQEVLAAETQTVTLQIRYTDEATGQEVAAPYKAVLQPGDTYTAESPDVEGYTLTDPALATVSGTATADTTYEVTYTAGSLTFTVHHYFETIDGVYKLDSTLDAEITASRNQEVTVQPAERSGYTCVSDLTVYVPTSGTVDKDLYYDRTDGDTVIYFETGATYVPYITAEPGTDITAQKAERMPGGTLAPTRAGYTFAGWTDEDGNDVEIPDTMPDANMKLTAKWTPGEADYTVVYRFREFYAYRYSWDGTPTGTPEYYDFMTVTKTGTTGDTISYSWDTETDDVKTAVREAFYEYESADTDKVIAADGSTVEYVYCQPVQVKLYLYSFWHRRIDVDENGEHTGTYDKGFLTEIWGGSPVYLRLGDYITLPSKSDLFDQQITYNGHTYSAWDLIFFNYSLPNSPLNDPDKYTVFWPYSNYRLATNFDYPPSTNMISGHPFVTTSMLDQTVVPGDPSTYHKDPHVSEDRMVNGTLEDYSDTRRNGTGVEYNYEDSTNSYVVSISPYYETGEVYDYYIRTYHENPDLTAAPDGSGDRVIEDNVNGNDVVRVYEPANYYHYQSSDSLFYMHPMFTRGYMLEYYARIRSGVAFDPDGTPPELDDTNFYLSSVNQPYDADDPAELGSYWLQHSSGHDRIYLELFYSARTYPLTFLDGSTVLAESRPSDAAWPADESKGGYAYGESVELSEAYQALTGNEEPTPPAGMEDYTFGGWYEEGDTTETVLTDAVTIQRGENRYVAKWIKPQYTVTFDSNGGSAVDSQTVDKNDTAVRPADPVRDGFEFLGWFYKDSLALYEFDMPVGSDIELIAMWRNTDNPVAYTVTHKTVDADGTVTVFKTETGSYPDNHTGKDGNPDHYVTARALHSDESDFPQNTVAAPLAAGLLIESGERDIVFTYTPYPEYTYTIRYLDRDTGREIADSRTITDTAQILTIIAPDLTGYELDQDSVYGQASAVGDRTITFYYKHQTPDSTTQPDSTTRPDSTSPRTGDMTGSAAALCAALLAASGMGAAVLLLKKRRDREI